MNNYIGRVVVLVRDYEAAKAFYTRNFGFQPLYEQSTPDGRRFVHVGIREPNAMGVWFLLAETPDQEALVGRQTGEQPLMVIYTSSLTELHETLQKNGVKITVAPVIVDVYSYLHCLDLYGNELVVVEMSEN